MADMKCRTSVEDQCQANTANGQCFRQQSEGSKYCQVHGCAAGVKQIRANATRQYRLGKWQDRVNEFVDNSQLMTVTEEIGILRISLEEIIKTCETPTDLILAQPQITRLVSDIARTVEIASKLNKELGETISKTQVQVQLEAIFAAMTDAGVTPEQMQIIQNSLV